MMCERRVCACMCVGECVSGCDMMCVWVGVRVHVCRWVCGWVGYDVRAPGVCMHVCRWVCGGRILWRVKEGNQEQVRTQVRCQVGGK
jgi:hypothetical protein